MTLPDHADDRQADAPPIPAAVTDLLATLVRTAAPRLGRVAVARITGPLTEAIVEMRAAALGEADGWHQVAAALGASDPTDPSSAMAALMERNARREGEPVRNVLDSVAHLAQRWAEYGPQARKHLSAAEFPEIVHGLDNLQLEHERLTGPVTLGSVLTNTSDLVRAGVGAVVEDRCGDRGVVVSEAPDADSDPDGTPTGVRWGSGAATGPGSWPLTVLVVAP